MAELDLTNISAASIATPSAGVTALFVDTDRSCKRKTDTGYVNSYQNAISTASQNMAAASRTYLNGSNIKVGSIKLQQGSMFRWRFNMTKTAAGIASSVFDIAVGVAGTIADTARCSFTKPAGTAVADEAWVGINAIVRASGLNGILVAEFVLMHNLSATGHAPVPCVVLNSVSAPFDMTVANLNLGICVTPGASDNLTFQMVMSEVWDV